MARLRSRQYSHAYERFITTNDSVIGLVAYGLFKDAKVKFLRNFVQSRGREASDQESFDWSEEHSQGRHRQGFLDSATLLINQYKKDTLEQERAGALGQIHAMVSNLTNWRGAATGCLTGLFTNTLFIALGVLLIVGWQGRFPWPASEMIEKPARTLAPR